MHDRSDAMVMVAKETRSEHSVRPKKHLGRPAEAAGVGRILSCVRWVGSGVSLGMENVPGLGFMYATHTKTKIIPADPKQRVSVGARFTVGARYKVHALMVARYNGHALLQSASVTVRGP